MGIKLFKYSIFFLKGTLVLNFHLSILSSVDYQGKMGGKIPSPMARL